MILPNKNELTQRWKTKFGISYIEFILKNHSDEDRFSAGAKNFFGYVEDYIDLRGIQLCSAKLDRACFSYCDLSYSTFNKVSLQKSEFNSSHMIHSKLTDTHFFTCSLVDANCEDMTIKNCTFNSTNLNGANFVKSKISDTLIKNCDLMTANFSASIIKNLRLNGENWFKSSTLPYEIKKLVEENIADTSLLERVRWYNPNK